MLGNGIDFLGIIFELTIFYLLFISVYKIVKTHLIPLLYSQIDSINKKEKDLKEKKILFVDSQKRVTGQIKSQTLKFLLLEKKISLWKNFIIQERNKKVEKIIRNFQKR